MARTNKRSGESELFAETGGSSVGSAAQVPSSQGADPRLASAQLSASQVPSSTGAPTFDMVMAELEGVVTELERGDLPLERALARFETGVRLAREGESLLRNVEQRVEELLAERGETVPFALQDDDEES